MAISPKAVAFPVATTTAVAIPLTTEVPRKIMFEDCIEISGEAVSAGDFSTGIDSPVRAAS